MGAGQEVGLAGTRCACLDSQRSLCPRTTTAPRSCSHRRRSHPQKRRSGPEATPRVPATTGRSLPEHITAVRRDRSPGCTGVEGVHRSGHTQGGALAASPSMGHAMDATAAPACSSGSASVLVPAAAATPARAHQAAARRPGRRLFAWPIRRLSPIVDPRRRLLSADLRRARRPAAGAGHPTRRADE